LDKAIRQAEIALAPRLFDGALLGNVPSLAMINPDATQRSMDFRPGYAIEKSADIQYRKTAIVKVRYKRRDMAAATKMIEVVGWSPAASYIHMNHCPSLAARCRRDEYLMPVREDELVDVGAEHRRGS
jgi:hypothetical protein